MVNKAETICTIKFSNVFFSFKKLILLNNLNSREAKLAKLLLLKENLSKAKNELKEILKKLQDTDLDIIKEAGESKASIEESFAQMCLLRLLRTKLYINKKCCYWFD